MRSNILFLFVFFLFSCASAPVVDTKGIDRQAYKQDLKECEELASQVDGTIQAAKEGLFGAVVYGAIGAVMNGDGEQMAQMGAITGAAGGASKGSMEKGQVLRNCLRGRGYNVLN